VRELYTTTDSTLYIGTQDAGFASLHGDDWTYFTAPFYNLPSNNITALLLDQDERIYAGTSLSGYSIRENDIWSLHRVQDYGLPSNLTRSLCTDSHGGIWTATTQGISCFDGSEWTAYNSENSELPSGGVGCVVVDQNDVAWIGTLIGGLARYDGESWQIFNTQNSSLPIDNIRRLAVDSQGRIWFSAWTCGFGYYDGSSFTLYDTSNSLLPHDWVVDLAIDDNDVVWLATMNDNITSPQGAICRFDGTDWEVYTSSNSPLPSQRVHDIATAPDGSVWVCMINNYLVHIQGDDWTVYDQNNSGIIPGGCVNSVLVDSDENLWIGSFNSDPLNPIGGLIFYDGEQWVQFPSNQSGLVGFGISALIEDAHGHIWCGMKEDGINIYRGDPVEVHPHTAPPQFSSFCYPQPFMPHHNSTLTISYALPQSSVPVTLDIYNIKGRLICSEQFPQQSANRILWDGTTTSGMSCCSGIYFYKVTSGSHASLGKLLICK
jgi:streptogramin lyase